MSKARELADFVAAGNPLADGSIDVSEVTGAAPTASPTFTGDATFDTDTLAVDSTNNRVGIGTSSPSDNLDVASAAPTLRLTDTDGYYSQIYAGSGSLVFRTDVGQATSGDTMQFVLSGSEAMRIDSSGNVGIGVVPSAWRSSTDAIQFGQSASISSNNNANAVSFTSNSYINSSNNNIYIATGKATNYYQYDGAHVWEYAGSGSAGSTVSYSEAMRIDSSGNLGLGTQTPSVKLDISSTDAIKIPAGTTAERPTGANGMLRYNSDDAQFEGYADGAWGAIAGGGGGDTQTATTTSTTQTAIASYAASTSLGIEITVVATDTVATERTITKLLVTHDGTTAVATQYGEVNTNTAVATFDVDISGGNVRLLATAASSNSTNFTASAAILA